MGNRSDEGRRRFRAADTKRAGRVILSADIDGVVCFFVEVWRVAHRCKGCVVFDTSSPSYALVDADAIVDTAIWSQLDGSEISVIMSKA